MYPPIPEEPVPRFDDSSLTKRNNTTSLMLILKLAISLPFNVIGILKPELLFSDFFWFLFMEAFHHYHARVFYLLALHRNLLQFYAAFLGNGLFQNVLLKTEVAFDFGLILLYIHEYYALHNVKVFFTKYVFFHFAIMALSSFALYRSVVRKDSDRFKHIA
jgi:hypothetical protein